MERKHLSASLLIARIGFALIFSIVGLLIVLVFSPYRPMLPRAEDFIGRIVLMSILYITFTLARKSKRIRNYWQAFFGLFILAAVVSVDWIIARYLLDYLGLGINTPAGFSLLKLSECILAVILVILFSQAFGFRLSALYVQKGHLRKGLTIGLIAFAVAAAVSAFISPMFFNARDLNLSKVISWLPWILIFVFSNAINEELLYRGLFLKKLEPLYGKLLSNILIVFVFTALHVGVTYSADQLMFLFMLIPLALAWGYTTQKTESLIGSVLFHAGMDIGLILGIFSRLS